MLSPRNRLMLWVLLPIVAGAAAGGAAYGNWDYRNYRIAQKAHALTGGDIARGKLAFARYGCGGCHTVTGVPQAHGKVGPPLDGIGTRGMIAGKLPNKPGNLEAWIQNPQAISPGTAMPTLGVTPADARDLAAFLYTAD